MLQFEELKQTLLNEEDALSDLADAMGITKLKEEVARLEEQAASPDFWNDMQASQKILQKTSALKNKIAAYEALKSKYEDALALIELCLLYTSRCV